MGVTTHDPHNQMTQHLKARMAIMREVKHAIREPYAWPGGYPLSIILRDGSVLCPACARKEYRQIAQETIVKGWERGQWSAAGVDILWEGGNRCEHCGECVDAYPSDPDMAAYDSDAPDWCRP